jgi:glycosyltransferase involved in cell wall biosynthesis
LIPSLNFGGAERMLIKLASTDPKKHVVLYLHTGPLKKTLDENCVNSIKIISSQIKATFEILKLLKSSKNTHLVCWLYESCIIGSAIKIINPDICVIFNFRNTLDNVNTRSIKRKVVLKVLCFFSSKVNSLIYNSTSGLESYNSYGITNVREEVIPNGFELNKFYNNSILKQKSREDLSLSKDSIIFIVSGRYTEVKRYDLILETFIKLLRKNKNVVLLMCGLDTEKLLSIIPIELIDNKSIHLYGAVEDVIPFYRSSDYLVLFSDTEGFPNVVGEAMACGLPCVVSDVGDCAKIVDKTGWIVPRGEIELLFNKLEEAVNLDVDEYKRRSFFATKKINDQYSIENISIQYNTFLDKSCDFFSKGLN